MSTDDLLGLWYCHTVDQEQSEEEEDEFGEYDDFGREPQKASKTEHAQTKIDFRSDGTYELTGGDDYMTSKGTWTLDGTNLELTEVEPAGGYDGMEYTFFRGSSLTIAYKLIPDAHDGLDILVLQFTRDEPKARGPKPEGLVDRLAQAEDTDEMWEALDQELDEKERDPAEVARELWDAVVQGQLLADPESDAFHDQLEAIGDDRLTESGGFTHDHALALLPKTEPRDDLGDLLQDLIASLPADAKDEQLAPHMSEEWLKEFAQSRFLGGGAPEELFRRPVFPQPAMDEASRAYALRSDYTRFEAIEQLFPPGHPDSARVAIRYRGQGLLSVPLALLRTRGLVKEAREIALATVADDKAMRSLGIRHSALVFAIALSVELGEPIPNAVFEELTHERQGMMFGSLTPEERQELEQMIADLPEARRELVTEKLYLDK